MGHHLNWSTDGDPARQLFSSLMSHEISDHMLKSIISYLKLFDTKVGENNETTNFDPKHLAKRMRNFLIGNSEKIGEKLVQPSDISKVLSASKSFDSKHKVQRLLNPDDKQNVDVATDFLLQLSKVDMKYFMEQGFRLSNVAEELYVCDRFTFALLLYNSRYLYTIAQGCYCCSRSVHFTA